MITVMKKMTILTMKDWEKMGEIDVVKESTNLLMRVILACAFAIEDPPYVD